MNVGWINNEFKKGLVSVIIPSYNRGNLLSEAIHSVILQSYRPIECIIVDDGSIDNTKDIFDNVVDHIDDQFSIKYLFQKNSGVQIARNVGTIASSGEFIQYLDSDDLLMTDKLLIQVDYLNNHTTCDGVFGDWKVGTLENNKVTIAHKEDDLISQFLSGCCISNFSFLMRRNIVVKIGCWDISINRNQEIDFQLHGLLIGARYDYLSLMCGLWRIHKNDRINYITGLNETIFFFEKWESILSKNKLLTPVMCKRLANLYWWLFTECEFENKDLLLKLLKKMVKLDPTFQLFTITRFKLVSEILGYYLSLRVSFYKLKILYF